jgi:hypothetical protein
MSRIPTRLCLGGQLQGDSCLAQAGPLSLLLPLLLPLRLPLLPLLLPLLLLRGG